jgi:nucleoside-diphosphate-sugar epimerase
LVLPCLFLVHVLAKPIVITGATGRTGTLLYNELKKQGKQVRGFVRSAKKARDKLGCDKCDESEGIFVGDIRDKTSMTKAMTGAGVLVMLTASSFHCDPFPLCTYSNGSYPLDIDWHGAKNTMEAFAETAGIKPVVYLSAMSTTEPDNMFDKIDNGQSMFYKLNFEAELMSSGLPFTIAKPCGLGTGKGHNATITVGHNQDLLKEKHTNIEREDLARVLSTAARYPYLAKNLRFDICAKVGASTTDIGIPSLFRAARRPWQLTSEEVVV